MVNTFLFDLDGTLLPLEWEVFEKEYFKSLACKLSDHFEPELLIKYVWNSTMKMIGNTGGENTNEKVFYQDFISSTGKDLEVLQPIFNDFYVNEFNQLKRLTRVEPIVVKTVDLLYDRGYTMVVATNPLFPISAIKARISWAGLDEKKFKFVTCFEKMHYCKPNVEFFKEVIDIIRKNAEECIMVGNDVEEDLVASKLGIKTFLVTDYMINIKGIQPPADYTGSYEELYNFVNESFPPLI